MPSFLRSGVARGATVFLLLQTVLLYSAMRPEVVPPGQPLLGFPLQLGSWSMAREGVVDQETRDVLKADDLLNREYRSTAFPQAANFFVAAFQSQRNGKTPHSPKNCLPGNGWVKEVEGQYTFDPGTGPITVNRYIVTHATERSVVMYWYQSRDRVVASEYSAKFWVIMDSIRLHRTDTALVRITVPVVNGNDDAATQAAVDIVRSFYPSLRHFLPA
jgi:EpsI family protein